jgi:uncharacterized protein
MIVICDNSPISALLAIGELDLLQKIYGQVCIPRAVLQELEALADKGTNIASILEADWIKVYEVSPANVSFPAKFHAGEIEAMLLALELKADWLIIDEHEGRKMALSLGIKIVGLLGVLIRAKQDGLITSLRDFLDKLQTHSKFRLSEAIKQKAIEIVGE